MKTTSSRSHVNQETVEQASAWFVEFRVGDADAAAREEFNCWLRRSPEHVQAYLEIARTYAELPASHPEQKIDVEALIAYARSDSNVVPLPARAPQRTHPPVSPAPSTLRARQVTLAASVLIAAVGVFAWVDMQRGVYSTAIGEQRSVTLADGSTLDLNARSRIRVRYSDQARNVDLLEGQALFRVAKDTTRPFIVRSDGTNVRAVGTQFDVYRRKSGTTVTVLEGRVAVLPAGRRAGDSAAEQSAHRVESSTQRVVVKPADAAGESASSGTNLPTNLPGSPDSGTMPGTGSSGGAAHTIFLSAGEQVTVTAEHVAVPTRANVAAATAWTQRRLVFEASPLTQVAEEFNRYTTRPLIVEDTQLEEFLISGVYSSTDPASLVLFLREQPGIHVTETDTEIRISRK